MQIHIENKQTDLPVELSSIDKAISVLLIQANLPHHGFNVYLVTTAEICQLHQDFFDDPTTTDCISFPLDDKEAKGQDLILGEVFVCPQTAIDYAKKHQQAVYDELLLYIVHGFLHCLGYDDIEENDEKIMRQKEVEMLALLKKEGISLDFHSKTIL